MHSDGHEESASSSSTILHANSISMESELDERISTLLISLRPSSQRAKAPRDGDEEKLRRLHRQLEALINEESDDHRRRRLRHILPAANCVRDQLLVLRRLLHNGAAVSAPNYAAKMHAALTAIMKESFEEEYRKLANFVGVLDAVAEALVLDVDVFGIDCDVENRTIRKLIASTLTNLTFGSAQSKQLLCCYPNLVEYVIKIIDESQNLAQVYAGLLRNLSWMADAAMSARLCCTVPALARASLRAYNGNEPKCLCATLSALWNLAAHSMQNKEALCEIPHCLDMLIELLHNDAHQTALVEPASGVLKYASIYLAVVGANRYLTVDKLHKMILRLIELLNSPSFTIIGNSLGVLAQLLAKDEQLRIHIRWNHKAMQLLNHLRNSNRDDIRNPVKTVLDYLNSADINGAFIQQYDSSGTTAAVGYRSDGMSSSYGGPATAANSFLDSSRLLKLRSAQSHAAGPLSGECESNEPKDLFTFNSPLFAAPTQLGFAPRPGDRQQQFASLPRHFFQKSKAPTEIAAPADIGLFTQPQSTTEFSQSNFAQTTLDRNSVKPASQADPYLTSIEGGDVYDNEVEDLELAGLEIRSDDPSFEVEDSVRCTRCTSTQSLSSMLPGEKSTWESCNNSAINSNRLSPASTTDLPDSPTQCMPSRHDVSIPSAHSLEQNSTDSIQSTENSQARKDKDEGNNSKPDEAAATVSQLTGLKISGEHESSISNDKMSRGEESSIQLRGSLDDDGDYGSFTGRADSELLDQSIEAAMPKRIEVNDDLLAVMIEQVQPKPSPVSRRQPHYSRNFSSASTARAYSGSSSIRTDDEDFLLQSIASVLPQSSYFRRGPSRTGSPPKKARAVTGDTARSSTGPKHNFRAVYNVRSSSSRRTNRKTSQTANSLGQCAQITICNQQTASSSAALFSAALQCSSLVENAQTCEKVRDASSLRRQPSNEGSDTLSDDNYSQYGDDEETVDMVIPFDVDQEFQAEQLLIDCSVVRESGLKELSKSAVASVSSPASTSRRSCGVRKGSKQSQGSMTAASDRIASVSALQPDSDCVAAVGPSLQFPLSKPSVPGPNRVSSATGTVIPEKRHVNATRGIPSRAAIKSFGRLPSEVARKQKVVATRPSQRAVAHVTCQPRQKPSVAPKPRLSVLQCNTQQPKIENTKIHEKQSAKGRIEGEEVGEGLASKATDAEIAAASAESRSARVLPFNCRISRETSDLDVTGNQESFSVSCTDVTAFKGSFCEPRAELKKKSAVKQMLVTTV